MKSLEKKKDLRLDMPADYSGKGYPCFYVSNDQMKEIDTWKVGEEYVLKVKVCMKSHDKRVTLDTTRSNADFEMLSYEVIE